MRRVGCSWTAVAALHPSWAHKQARWPTHHLFMLYECTGTSNERQSRLLEIPTENEKGWGQRAKSWWAPPPLPLKLVWQSFCYSAYYCCFVSKYRICQIMMVRHHHPGAIWMTPTPPSSPTLELPVWSRHNIFSLCPNHLFPILFDNSLIMLTITWTSYIYICIRRDTQHICWGCAAENTSWKWKRPYYFVLYLSAQALFTASVFFIQK